MDRDPAGERQSVPRTLNRGTMTWLQDHVRNVFDQQRQLHYMRHGLTPSPLRAKENIWQTAALFFLKNKLNIECCLERRFALTRDNPNVIVYPASICSPKLLDEYREACADLPAKMQASFASQQHLCRQMLVTAHEEYGFKNDREALTFVLANENLEFTPLFRCCLAASEKLWVVHKHFAKDALRQYLLASDEYNKVWDKWITPAMKLKAKAVTGGYVNADVQ